MSEARQGGGDASYVPPRVETWKKEEKGNDPELEVWALCFFYSIFYFKNFVKDIFIWKNGFLNEPAKKFATQIIMAISNAQWFITEIANILYSI